MLGGLDRIELERQMRKVIQSSRQGEEEMKPVKLPDRIQTILNGSSPVREEHAEQALRTY